MRDRTPALLPLVLDSATVAVAGVPILDRVSFTLEAGSRSVVLGANGAGKSVLLRLCHGLLAPTAGTMRWLGPHAGDPGRFQAMVFQRPIMLRRSVIANVAYGLKLAGIAKAERLARAHAALARVGLAHLAGRPARLLSGGEQQLAALARAWVLEPEVLFLDEPTASLDPAATRAVEAIVGAIHTSGTKIVMTTHNLGQARRVADEILFLDRGRLIERAGVDRFFAGPATTEARAFIEGELP
ncbi:MAG: ATP-binding cassette domain-containing protein [Alphaproteobacteria bacterium]|nr:ATP-binding cassette domain-containing protein [Alphaproteobacteria bacterium]